MSDSDAVYNFTHGGKSYYRFTEAAALAAGVPQATIDAAKVAAALTRLAARRKIAERAGITWEEHPVATDDKSQAKLAAAYNLAQQTGFTSLKWRCADGSFITLDAADVTELANAVAAHVEACFDNEAALRPAVQADPTADIETGWPA